MTAAKVWQNTDDIGASDANRWENGVPDNGVQAVGKGEIILRVADYGADVPALADTSAAIQACLAAANAKGGGTAQLTRGLTYPLTTGLNVPSSVTLSGKATLQMTAGSTNRAILVQNQSNVVLADFIVDLNKTATPNGGNLNTQQGIYVSTTGTNVVSNIKISNVTVMNGWQRGIAVISSTGNSFSNVTIEDVTIENVAADGIFVEAFGISDLTSPSTSQGVQISGSNVSGVGKNGIQIAGVSDCAVDDNRIDGTGAAGHGIVFSTTGSTSLVTDFTATGNKVRGFTATSPQSRWGICVSVNCTRLALVGNVINGCAGGITVDLADGSRPNAIIDVSGTLTGNTVTGSTANHGINVNQAQNLTVTGNTSVGNALSGLALANCITCTVDGNTLTSNGEFGLAVFTDAGLTTPTGGHTIGANMLTGNAQGNFAVPEVPPIPLVLHMPPTVSVLAADSASANNTSTFIASGLSAALDAGTYEISGFIPYVADPTGKVQFKWSGPAGFTGKWVADILTSTATAVNGTTNRQSLSITSQANAAGVAPTDVVAMPKGTVTLPTNGTLAFQFAQITPTAADTIIRAGAFVKFNRLA